MDGHSLTHSLNTYFRAGGRKCIKIPEGNQAQPSTSPVISESENVYTLWRVFHAKRCFTVSLPYRVSERPKHARYYHSVSNMMGMSIIRLEEDYSYRYLLFI